MNRSFFSFLFFPHFVLQFIDLMQYFPQMKLNNYSWLTVYVSLDSVAVYFIWYHFIYLAEIFVHTYRFFFFLVLICRSFIQIESNICIFVKIGLVQWMLVCFDIFETEKKIKMHFKNAVTTNFFFRRFHLLLCYDVLMKNFSSWLVHFFLFCSNTIFSVCFCLIVVLKKKYIKKYFKAHIPFFKNYFVCSHDIFFSI